MKGNKSSRRTFLGKVVAKSVTLTALAGVGQNAFSVGLDLAGTGASRITPLDNDEKKFVPVMITPYDKNLKIDFEALSKLIDFYLSSGVKGFFANCLSSEMYHLDEAERLALARYVVNQVNGAVPVVATGSFGESVEDRAEFTKKMYDTGVKGVILITSHFANKGESDQVFIQNMEKFLGLTGTIPLGTYECPAPYKRILTPETLQYLLRTNRLVYHKDTSLDTEKIKVKLEIVKGSKLEFYDAHTPNAIFSLQTGAKGLSCIAGNFYPEVFSWMCTNVNDPNRQEDVKWLQSELTRCDSIISDGYPTSAKYFMQKRGLPIQPVARTTQTQLSALQKQALDKIYNVLPQWHERLGIQAIH